MLSHGSAFEIHAVAVVGEPVEDRVGERTRVDVGMSLIDREL